MKFSMRLLTLSIVFGLTIALSGSVYGQGALFRGVGAVNEGFGGASTAAPLDAAGAMYWNPATISALKCNEMQFGLGLVLPFTELSSTYTGPGAAMPDFFQPGSGTTKGSVGSLPSPSAAMVWKTPNKRLTLGFMFAGVGGAATMYPWDPDNPIMNPEDPAPFPRVGEPGVRASNVQIIQALPTASYQLTRRLSVGVTPVLNMGKLEIHPSAVAGTHEPTGSRYLWGGGVHAGVFYQADNCFNYGFTVKSPQWIENVMAYGKSAHSFDLNLPLILSAGVSYTGIRNTILAVDVRYFDWANTNGFSEAGPWGTPGKPDYQLRGLGWDSIFSVAMGVERKINKTLKIRGGYCWNQNPVPDKHSFYNVSAPLIMEHTLSCGASVMFAHNWETAFAYCHAFSNSITGPFPDGVPGNGTVTSKAGAGIINASVIKRF